MTQGEVDLVYRITIIMYEHPWFKEKSRTRDEVQNWVREQLSQHNIFTVPVGMSWGVLTDENYYIETIFNNYVQRSKREFNQ